ncbi:DUF84 family protein [Virgibacillus sp. W0430]|uniref:DUF84 family protein n=1 Tax=Virgibacillus sp. W0430 TaxID=3391580 RepID=UPI003F4773E1
MKISVGSKNRTKTQAVQCVFATATIYPQNVQSNVSSQPFSDEETRLGAINRAVECNRIMPETVSIGLEGGVTYVEKELHLCNWGALVTKEKKIFTASGAKILLPHQIGEQLKEGIELGEIMDRYAQKSGVRQNEGAIGIFTNGEVSRKEMFVHIVHLLKGQWAFNEKK